MNINLGRARFLKILLLFLSACSAIPPAAPGNESIRAEVLKADLHFLASDQMRGRFVGTPQNLLAAEYVRSRFERMGLSPASPDGSFFQPFGLVTFTKGEANALELRGLEGGPQSLGSGRDFTPLTFSAAGQARGGLVYAGFGIVAPPLSYDDYRGQDVRGKIVLVLEHEPGEQDPKSPFDGLVTSEFSIGWRKALAAQERGAAGILFVRDIHTHGRGGDFSGIAEGLWPTRPRRIELNSLAEWMDRIKIPAAQISVEVAARLVRGSDRTLEDLSAAAETVTGLGVVQLPGPEVDLRVSVSRHAVPARNVVALLEGSDPQLKREVVIVCGHFDHDGADGDRIFNGADDNGSGTIGVLDIAEAYASAARAGRRPRRTILFAAWDAEERGLLGAWYYTEHPLRPLKDTVAVLNMDMIGRNEEVIEPGSGRFRGLEAQTAQSNAHAVNILGSTRSADLKSEAERANGRIGLELKFRYDNNVSNLLRRSDHWPFLQCGVPAVWFFTGLHPDYHTPQDRPERVEYGKMQAVARLVHQMSWNLAEQDGRPRMDRR